MSTSGSRAQYICTVLSAGAQTVLSGRLPCGAADQSPQVFQHTGRVDVRILQVITVVPSSCRIPETDNPKIPFFENTRALDLLQLPSRHMPTPQTDRAVNNAYIFLMPESRTVECSAEHTSRAPGEFIFERDAFGVLGRRSPP